MEPGFQRGDILFLENNTEELIIGDVVVFKIKGRDIPIVHRVLSKYKRCVICCGDGDYAAAVSPIRHPCAGAYMLRVHLGVWWTTPVLATVLCSRRGG